MTFVRKCGRSTPIVRGSKYKEFSIQRQTSKLPSYIVSLLLNFVRLFLYDCHTQNTEECPKCLVTSKNSKHIFLLTCGFCEVIRGTQLCFTTKNRQKSIEMAFRTPLIVDSRLGMNFMIKNKAMFLL